MDQVLDLKAVLHEIAGDGLVGPGIGAVALRIGLPQDAPAPFKGFDGWVGVNENCAKEILAVALSALALDRPVTVRAHFLDNGTKLISALRINSGK